jgi:hypothetical protein
MAILAAAVVIAAAAGMSSCETYILPSLELSQDTILVNKAAQELAFVVNTNVEWSFEMETANARWIDVTPQIGDCTATVTILIDENDTGAARRATVPVKTSTLQKNLYIVQSGDEELPAN